MIRLNITFSFHITLGSSGSTEILQTNYNVRAELMLFLNLKNNYIMLTFAERYYFRESPVLNNFSIVLLFEVFLSDNSRLKLYYKTSITLFINITHINQYEMN